MKQAASKGAAFYINHGTIDNARSNRNQIKSFRSVLLIKSIFYLYGVTLMQAINVNSLTNP